MRIDPTPLRCLSCGHEWIGETVQDASASVLLASLKAVRCPDCGAMWNKIAMRSGAAKAVAA
jgi:DNA-directed RNA polymerase subunit N (RpoN/RPB10)